MEAWKQIGKVPIEHADDIWNRFKAAKDHFFNAKRQFHEKQKVTFADNYAQKLALVNRAMQIKNSLQWRTVTDEMNELMDEWKKIGPVAREHSNKLWDDFIGARKYFFERKDADRDKRKQFIEQQEKKKVEHKKAFLHKLDEELQEEIEKLADFKVAIENITPGNKEAELRAHLTSLIAQTEQRITQKRKKLEESNASAAKDETPSTAADEPLQS
jgi:polyhydroxyalkanoate synthesis regulator phasin